MCLFFLIYFGFSAWPEDGGVKPEGRRGNGGGGRAGKDEGDTPPGAEGLERYPSRESEGERITTVTAAVAVTAIVTESAIATVTAPRTVRCLLLLLFFYHAYYCVMWVAGIVEPSRIVLVRIPYGGII